MSPDLPAPGEPAGSPPDAPFDVPDLGLLDDGAIRRAVRRGVLRTSLAAAAWVVLATVVVLVGALVFVGRYAEHFHDVAYLGAQVGRPGYASNGNSFDSGLSNVQGLDLHVRGALGDGDQINGKIRRSITGGIEVALPAEDATPIGAALQRDRPSKAGTAAFLQTLPSTVSASAIVEFSTPLDAGGLDDMQLTDDPGMSPGGNRTVLLNDPYGGDVVSWPEQNLTGFGVWLAELTPRDDDALQKLGSPSLAVLRSAARTPPGIHAVIVQQATVAELQRLLRNPQVRSVNIAEVAFDPARQNSGN